MTMLTTIVRWSARILSIASIVMLLLFLFGEGDPSEIGQITLREWVLFAFFPFGVMAGMIIGWWREGLGGAITTGSLVLFYVMNLALHGDMPGGPYFVIFALPGLLFLVCWATTLGHSATPAPRASS